MTPDEIRQRAAADLAAVEDVQVDSGRVMALALMRWLPELVAQVAEQNQWLGLIDESLSALRLQLGKKE